MAEKYTAQDAIPTCEDHEGEELHTFCRTCDKRTCEECVKTTHKDHDWATTAKMVKERRNKRKEIVHDIREQILPAMKGESRPNQEEVARVRRVQRLMIDHINKYSDSLVAELEGEEEEPLDWTKEIELLAKIEVFFENKVLDAHENVVLEVDHDYKHIKQQVATKITDQCRRRFVAGHFLPETLQQMVGRVVYATDDKDSASVPCYSVSDSTKFNCGAEAIIDIISINQDDIASAWLHQMSSSKILLVDSSGEVKQEREINFTCPDFIVLDNDDHVFTRFGKHEIRKVLPTGNISVVCSTAPLCPTGICRSRDGRHILVCLCDCNVTDITTESKGEIHYMDMEGTLSRKYQRCSDGMTKLFTNPRRVTQNVNLDICVIDVIDTEFRTSVIGITEGGVVKFTYTGHTSLEEPFSASDICCDQYKRIMLTDTLNDAVHVLSADGDFLQFLLTTQDGLWGPKSLALREDTLWVGCCKGEVFIVKLKFDNK